LSRSDDPLSRKPSREKEPAMKIDRNLETDQEARLQPPCETPQTGEDDAVPKGTQGPPQAYLDALEALSSQYDVVVPIIQNLDGMEKEGPDPSVSLTFTVAHYAMQRIRKAKPSDRVCLILHTLGGLYLPAEMIADQLKRHPGETTVFVPYIATSGGTLIALSADNLVLGQCARLGPTDSVTCGYQSGSYANLIDQKNLDRIDDQTLLIGYDATKFYGYVRQKARKLLNPSHHHQGEGKYRVADAISDCQNSHGRGFDREDLLEMGVRLAGMDDCPAEVYALVDA